MLKMQQLESGLDYLKSNHSNFIDREISRRGLFALAVGLPAAIASSTLINLSDVASQIAYASVGEDPWWDDNTIYIWGPVWYEYIDAGQIGSIYGESGGWQSGVLYKDRVVGAKTPWVEWDLNGGPGSPSYLFVQNLRSAMDFRIRDRFTTELYHHVQGEVNMAAGSYDWRPGGYTGGHRWQVDTGDDAILRIRQAINDQPYGGSEIWNRILNLDNNPDYGNVKIDGGHYWTPYISWNGRGHNASVVDYTEWKRRESSRIKYSYQVYVGHWNYYHYDHYNSSLSGLGSVDAPAIRYHTPWLEQYSETIKIHNRVNWFGRVVEIIPVADTNKRFDASGGGIGQSTKTNIWDNLYTTNQNWCILANTYRRGLVTLKPVHVGRANVCLDHYGGGPTETPTPALLWTENNSAAQAIWLHQQDGKTWFFSDCSGMALDRVGGGLSNGTQCQWHSNGYCDSEWGNVSHQWLIRDAIFTERSGRALSLQGDFEANDIGLEVSPDAVAVTVDPTDVCVPYNYPNTAGMAYELYWMATDDKPTYLNNVEVIGQISAEFYGQFEEQPGVSLIGTVGIGTAMTGFRLRLNNAAEEGSICYQIHDGSEWSNTLRDGEVYSGTVKQVKVWLEGKISTHWYLALRAHVANVGWKDWVETNHSENDEASAVIAGDGNSLEGLQVQIRPKNFLKAVRTLSPSTVDSGYITSESIVEKYLTCLVRAIAVGDEIRYRGTVRSNSVFVRKPRTIIKYYADNETEPCFVDNMAIRHEPYTPPQEAFDAGFKSGCESFDCWYTDAEYKHKFVPGTIVEGKSMNLYGRNECILAFDTTESSVILDDQFQFFKDRPLTIPLDDPKTLYPSSRSYWYGQVATFNMSSITLYYDAFRIDRTINPQSGVYLTADVEGKSAISSLKLVRNTIVYVHWPWPVFDGVRDQRVDENGAPDVEKY